MTTDASPAVLQSLLNRMPGVAWSARVNPAMSQITWIFVNPRTADLYDVTEAEMMANPLSLMQRLVDEDRPRIEQMMAHSMATLTSLCWIGRIALRSGSIRWIEAQTSIEADGDDHQIWYGTALDVTERKLAEAEQVRMAVLHQAVIEALPVGVIVMDPSGNFIINNPAAVRINGRAPVEGDAADLTRAYGAFRLDGVTPYPNEELPLVRAAAGEDDPEVELILRGGNIEGNRRLLAKGTPIRDASGKIIAGMAVTQDVTQKRELEQEIRRRNEQLAASEAAKSALIERLRYSIDELSNPILEVWDDVLAMPIIGMIDSRRTADMVQRLLAEVARTQASFVIVDLTGVEIVDTRTADHLVKLIRKVELVGARCVLTGIRPAVAETLVDIGVDFGRITTLRNLKHGLRDALRHARGEREQPHDLDGDDEPVEREKRPRARAR